MAWQEGGISWDLSIHHLVTESGKISQGVLWILKARLKPFPVAAALLTTSVDPVATLLRCLSLSLAIRR